MHETDLDQTSDLEFSVEGARRAAERDALDDWVRRFLASPGSDNGELGEQLSDGVRWWTGPLEVPIGSLHRLAGPPDEPVLCPGSRPQTPATRSRSRRPARARSADLRSPQLTSAHLRSPQLTSSITRRIAAALAASPSRSESSSGTSSVVRTPARPTTDGNE